MDELTTEQLQAEHNRYMGLAVLCQKNGFPQAETVHRFTAAAIMRELQSRRDFPA